VPAKDSAGDGDDEGKANSRSSALAECECMRSDSWNVEIAATAPEASAGRNPLGSLRGRKGIRH
jgi:hypothetical protein